MSTPFPKVVEGDSSKESSPEARPLLEHSMESLIVSDTSEDGILTENAPGNEVDCISEDAVLCPDDMDAANLEEGAGEAGSGDGVVTKENADRDNKQRKKRLSKRRGRKISLSSSDRMVSEVAGVKIEVTKQGFLLQQGSFQRWNRRYFTITDDKLYVSKTKEDNLREEIILKDTTVAENSSKNVNHSFTVLTPFQQVILAASSRKEMEEWTSAFKLAASKSKHTAVLETLQHLEGQHSWFACTHSRPTYCNVCRDSLHGVAWHGLSCEVCKFKSHRRCVFQVKEVCKWTTRSSLEESGVQLGQDFAIPHEWIEGNLPAGSKCSVCDRTCGSFRRLQDFRCLWCKFTVHAECRDRMDEVCNLGDHCLSILPPSALQRSDVIRKGMWEPYQVYGHSPVLAYVNSKSGDNLGVKFFRKLKYWLNPAQVFDLAITGPDLGLQLFQRFEKFRIIVFGGDGSIGWVLSAVDKYNLHSKCMVGVVPLGTGNDMARVLGWGSQCREEEKIPYILSEMQQSSFKLLDRWSLQYSQDTDLDLTNLFGRHSPVKNQNRSGESLAVSPFSRSDSRTQAIAPFPGPDKNFENGSGVVSPDSVFAHQDSANSEDFKTILEASEEDHADQQTLDKAGDANIELSSSPSDNGGRLEVQRRPSSSSPQNCAKISAFHKSLLDLANYFSSLLISEDEKNVLKSAEMLGTLVKEFLSSLSTNEEDKISVSSVKDDPLIQKCAVLQDKLASLIANLTPTSQEAMPTIQEGSLLEKKFIERDALMARANSLKKAITSVMDVTEQVLDSHSEDMEEIKELTTEIHSNFKSRMRGRQPKESVSSINSVVDPAPLLPEMKELSVMNNYFGLGLDAKIAYKFNTTREKNPAQYKSRAKNMMLYGILGGKEFFANSQRYLERRIKLECDGEVVDLPQRLQGLVFLNIPSYMAGTNFWGTEREKDGFSAPSHDDKLMEVVAVSGLTSIATAKVLGIQNHRLRQCRLAKVTLSEELPVQVDGEAWLQKPGTVVVSHKNKARMLVKDKAFSQTLESWKQKQNSSCPTQPSSSTSAVTSTLRQALNTEEMNRYRELAATIPPLFGYIKAESSVNSDVVRDLIPYVSSATHSLERIFLEGGLISDTADIVHLQDFERDLKALLQETLWFLSMQRISSENEAPLREAVKVVESNLRRLITPNISACSQAHHKFRRSSDTLLLNRPPYHTQPSLRGLSPHRERSGQLVPDDTMQAAVIIQKMGKEVDLWDADDVHQWLTGIGMAEYIPAFQQQQITGNELLELKKSDVQNMGVTKVGDSTKLYRALQALTSDSPKTIRTQRTSVFTVPVIHH